MPKWTKLSGEFTVASGNTVSLEVTGLGAYAFRKPPFSPWMDNDMTSEQATAAGWTWTYDSQGYYKWYINGYTGPVDSEVVCNIPRTIGGSLMSGLTSLGGRPFVRIGGTGTSNIYNGFKNCTTLTEVSFPNATNIGNYAFNGCTSLSSAYLPSCLEIWGSAFQNCYALNNINIESCRSTHCDAFVQCSNLTTISLPNCYRMEGKTFTSCQNLETVYLLSTSRALAVSVYWSGAYYTGPFHMCPNLKSIYVPASLVSEYRAAKGWSYYASEITAFTE